MSVNIDSIFVKTNKNNKLKDLKNLLSLEPFKSAVVFCNKKADIDNVSLFLKKNNFKTLCLHGDMNQNLRMKSLEQFKNKPSQVLIASDVVARGIDINGLSHVFNFDVPNNPEDYVHRIGRTGRAGKRGKAYTLFDDNDNKNVILIEKLIKKKVYKTTFDKIISAQKLSYKNFNPKKKINKYISKTFILPEENYLNFKESGKIPDFLK